MGNANGSNGKKRPLEQGNRRQASDFCDSAYALQRFRIKTISQFRIARIAGLTPILCLLRGKDDIAGGVMMGVFIIFVSAIIATAAAVFERILQNSVDIKSENDLSV